MSTAGNCFTNFSTTAASARSPAKLSEFRVRHRFANLRECAVNGFFGTAIDDDAGALACEAGGDGQADAFGGTGNEGEFVSKL